MAHKGKLFVYAKSPPP